MTSIKYAVTSSGFTIEMSKIVSRSLAFKIALDTIPIKKSESLELTFGKITTTQNYIKFTTL